MRLNLSDEPVTAELLAESLRKTGTARIAVSGTSMHPTLQMGWWIYVEPVGDEDLKPGAIAVFRGEHFLTVHRLIWIERRPEGRQLVFQGDYSRLRERVPASAVLGRVVAVEIPGSRRGLERVVALEGDVLSWFYRGVHALHAVLRPLWPALDAPHTPPGPVGRFMRRSLAGAERFLSLFLPQRR